jgi:hypothetical protein
MSDARLENLVRKIMKEEDPVEFDKLCSELWMVLDECDSLTTVEERVGRASTTTA